MDAQFAHDMATAWSALALRLNAQSAPTAQPLGKPTNSVEWHARRLKALQYVDGQGGTVTKADFMAYCTKQLGYAPQGLGSYWNRSEDKRLLHPHAEAGVEKLTISLRGCDILAEADAA